MQLHNIKPKNKLKKPRRIARGGKRGGYSGRGIKGQKSRAGAGIRPAIRDVMMRFPKQRGRAKHSFKSIFLKPVVLNLFDIDKKFKDGEIVNPVSLVGKKLVYKISGRFPKIKILGTGEISKRLNFQEVLLSSSARDKVKKAGGTIK
ncbi:MAG: uL15 family ribosomal protein [Parcubacteria group bacterium]|nr:uL15 family ribosomal protein [Parcubacteria group bacterium]